MRVSTIGHGENMYIFSLAMTKHHSFVSDLKRSHASRTEFLFSFVVPDFSSSNLGKREAK